jgi:diadenosine tetraphosphate (Ap4A) HIT family hydrolase
LNLTKEQSCLFCDIPADRIILENTFAYAIRDGFPVTLMHTLIIPKRHVVDYFGLDESEREACDQLLRELRTSILDSDTNVEGFNIGMNVGAVAGQTIFHAHIHLIPRRVGDVANPRGGVRHIIPDKGLY